MFRCLISLVLVVHLLIVAVGSSSVSAATSPLDQAAIDRFVQEQMRSQHIPGLALALTHGDTVLYVKGYGTAGDDQPVTPQTQFFIASVSKSFTALAVMQLVEAGKIALDAPVQTYLPDFTLADPTVAAQITVRQLLNHTSGLTDGGFPEMRLPQPATIAERVASLRTARSVAAPGSEFHYFNPNYGVLARVVEVVSGQPFSEYLATHIFAPLDMQHTFNVVTSADAAPQADQLAQGHIVAYGAPVAVDEMAGYLGGSGGVISTAEDMAHYLVMQNNGGRWGSTALLTPAGVQTMHTPPATSDSTYTMGWFAMTEDEQPVLEHNGVLSAFYTDIVLMPDSGYGLAVLYNINSLALDTLAFPTIKRGLIRLMLNEQPSAGAITAPLAEAIIGLLSLLSVALGIRSLLRLPAWQRRARTTPLWRLLPGIVWKLVPALVLIGLPALIALPAERVFNYASLFRTMLGIVVWLGVSAILGSLNALLRITWLVRHSRDHTASPAVPPTD